FVAQLLVAHSRAILILRAEQHGEQIACVLPERPPLADNPEYDFVQLPYGAPRAEVPRRRQPLREKDHAAKIRSIFKQNIQRLAHLRDITLHVRTEERLADHEQRQTHHLAVQLNLLPGLPSLG